jgi:Putative zinc-finger
MTRHVSNENLARFRADDLSPARARRVAAHLRDCARCRETSDALAEVPSLLARVEVPPMPAHLAARIETALAAESAHRAAGAPSAAGAPERPARPAGARRRHRRPVILSAPALRVLAVAGAAVVLVGGGVELLSHATGQSSSSSGASGASGEAPAAAPAKHKPGSTMTGGRSSASRPENGVQYQHDGHTASISPLRTGTHYRSARLTQQVDGVLGTSRAEFQTLSPNGGPTITGGPNASGAPPNALNGCVSLIAAGRKVLLVDIATFDRKPATIIVTARKGPAAAQAWVVGSGCSSTTRDVLAHRALLGH